MATKNKPIECPNCGKENVGPDLIVCNHCGYQPENEGEANQEESIPEENLVEAPAEILEQANISLDEIDEEESEDSEPEDIAHDEEFMDSIKEETKEQKIKKMTPEQAKKRRDYLIERNVSLENSLVDKEKVAELGKHYGLQILITNLENETCKEVKKHETKEAGKSLKALEAVLTFKTLVNAYNVSIREIKDEIASNEKELKTLGTYQTTLFDSPTSSEEKELSEVA